MIEFEQKESAQAKLSTHNLWEYLAWKPTNGHPDVNNWDKHDVESFLFAVIRDYVNPM